MMAPIDMARVPVHMTWVDPFWMRREAVGSGTVMSGHAGNS